MSWRESLALLLWGLLSRLLLPLALLRYAWLSLREPAYRRRWGERLGWAPGDERPRLWVHAVSLGEVRAATPLLEALLTESVDLLVTCATPTGSQQLERSFGGRVLHCYAPLDTPGCVARFLKRVRPTALVLIEAELWPLLLHGCRRRQIPVVLANARITARSAAGYRRYSALAAPALRTLRLALARTRDDGERLSQLGVAAERLRVVGDLKYSTGDPAQRAQQVEALASQMALAGRPVWVAGSTHAGEEETVLDAAATLWRQHPELVLLLAPRHPKRFDEVAHLLRRRRLPFARRSQGTGLRGDQNVLLLDSIGDLGACYGLAKLAFIGGSLVPTGGHNLLEAAAVSCPLLTGPHLHNFAEVAEQLRRAGALQLVHDSDELAAAAQHWLDDDRARQSAGEAGAALVAQSQQSLPLHLQAILPLHRQELRRLG